MKKTENENLKKLRKLIKIKTIKHEKKKLGKMKVFLLVQLHFGIGL